jgi:hypothetical protein
MQKECSGPSVFALLGANPARWSSPAAVASPFAPPAITITSSPPAQTEPILPFRADDLVKTRCDEAGTRKPFCRGVGLAIVTGPPSAIVPNVIGVQPPNEGRPVSPVASQSALWSSPGSPYACRQTNKHRRPRRCVTAPIAPESNPPVWPPRRPLPNPALHLAGRRPRATGSARSRRRHRQSLPLHPFGVRPEPPGGLSPSFFISEWAGQLARRRHRGGPLLEVPRRTCPTVPRSPASPFMIR